VLSERKDSEVQVRLVFPTESCSWPVAAKSKPITRSVTRATSAPPRDAQWPAFPSRGNEPPRGHPGRIPILLLVTTTFVGNSDVGSYSGHFLFVNGLA